MKRAVYIIIGLLVLGLLLIPILLRTPVAEKATHRLSTEGGHTEIRMARVRHVKIVEKLGEIDKDGIGILGKLDVQASSFSDKSILMYPKNKYLNVSQEGDYLLVEINLDDGDLSRITGEIEKGAKLILGGLNMELKTDSALLSIENRVSGVNISVKKMNLDSLYLFNDEWQDISLESCSFRSLDIRGKKLSLRANQVKAINYYEGLGTIRSSEISGFSVDNLYLSGKDSHRY